MKEEFKIYRLDNFGRGISYYNGKVIFVDGAIDGENVEGEVKEIKKNIFEADTLKVIDKSKDRMEPRCPYYDECGGCNIMHMSYSKQLSFKEEKVRYLLKKFADVEPVKVKPIIPTTQFGYRNKVTLKVREKIGFYKKKSYDIVPVHSCQVAHPKINEIIQDLSKLALVNIEEIIIKATLQNETMVVFKATGEVDEDYYISKLGNIVDTMIVVYDGIPSVISGNGYITEKVGDYRFKISSLSFFQVNTLGAERLYSKVKEYGSLQDNERVLDLYCGTGTIGIYLSDACKDVTGLEINGEAVKDAQDNIELNKVINVKVEQKDVSKVIDKYENIELVVVDPPRSGLSKKALSNVLEVNPNRIVYVSCDPATLSRDINLLKDNYEVKEVTPVDMFPNTYHVECVCLLMKK
jgi:23S rRNA (uracil1939-C5)-methyltransferase